MASLAAPILNQAWNSIFLPALRKLVERPVAASTQQGIPGQELQTARP